MNIDLSDFEIYKGKSFSSLCKEIVTNQNEKKDQLDVLISELRPLIKTVSDAMVIVPLLKEYFDVGVKNDEQLVKLAAVIQKIITRNDAIDGNDPFTITEDEKKELLSGMADIAKEAETILPPKKSSETTV